MPTSNFASRRLAQSRFQDGFKMKSIKSANEHRLRGFLSSLPILEVAAFGLGRRCRVAATQAHGLTPPLSWHPESRGFGERRQLSGCEGRTKSWR